MMEVERLVAEGMGECINISLGTDEALVLQEQLVRALCLCDDTPSGRGTNTLLEDLVIRLGTLV